MPRDLPEIAYQGYYLYHVADAFALAEWGRRGGTDAELLLIWGEERFFDAANLLADMDEYRQDRGDFDDGGLQA